MKIKVFLLEDNPITAQDIREILIENGMEVIKVCYSAEEALQEVGNYDPDIFLVDIKLKGEMSGIDFAKKALLTRKLPLVYLTANSDKETVKRAIDTNPSNFLTKPFEERDLLIALELAFSKFFKGESLSNAIADENYVFIKNGNQFEKVSLSEINYLEADGSYCKIFLPEKTLVLSGNLNSFHKRLSNQFLRVHRSFVVNEELVDSIGVNELTINGTTIPVGRSYKKQVDEKFKKFS